VWLGQQVFDLEDNGLWNVEQSFASAFQASRIQLCRAGAFSKPAGASCAHPRPSDVKAASTHNARKFPLRVNFPAFRVPAKPPVTPAASVRAMPLDVQSRVSELGGTMPTLTLEDIRKNPWNVVTYALPEQPSELLLQAAYLAADYCRRAEYILVHAAREGRYVPFGWKPGPDSPDAHEESEELGWRAEAKRDEIYHLLEAEHDWLALV
jgi:hypothetical protein